MFLLQPRNAVKGFVCWNLFLTTSRNCTLADLSFSDSRIKWNFLGDAVLTKVSPDRRIAMLPQRQHWGFSVLGTFTEAYMSSNLWFANVVQQSSCYHETKQTCGENIAQELFSVIYKELLARSRSAFSLCSQNTHLFYTAFTNIKLQAFILMLFCHI